MPTLPTRLLVLIALVVTACSGPADDGPTLSELSDVTTAAVATSPNTSAQGTTPASLTPTIPTTPSTTTTSSPAPTTSVPTTTANSADLAEEAATVWDETWRRLVNEASNAPGQEAIMGSVDDESTTSWGHLTPLVEAAGVESYPVVTTSRGGITIDDCLLPVRGPDSNRGGIHLSATFRGGAGALQVATLDYHGQGCVPGALAAEISQRYRRVMELWQGLPETSTEFLDLLTGEQLASSRELVSAMEVNNAVIQGSVEPDPVIYELGPAGGHLTTELASCVNLPDGWGVRTPDGAPPLPGQESQPPGHYTQYARLVRVEGEWLVTATTTTEESCPPESIYLTVVGD